ncbi:hypothetical protein QTP88_027293 [Uroleucon formosanum]
MDTNCLKKTATMTANDERTQYIVPSLLKSAYHACNKIKRNKYDELDLPDVNFKICCQSIFQIIKLNTESGCFDSLGDRRSMYHKVLPVVYKKLIKNICEKAAFHGHIDCLKISREIGVPWYDSSQEDQSECEPAEFHRLMYSKSYIAGHKLGVSFYDSSRWAQSACDQAAVSGKLDCLIYAHENGSQWNIFTCCVAAAEGNLECLRYAHENGCPWNIKTCIAAASGGHLDCLKYAHENGCPSSSLVRSIAAEYGHLDCLKYLHENGFALDKLTCSKAARKGYLDILRYAHENGCPWDTLTCSDAARYGHLDCLRYAHENGCPWDQLTCFNAAKNGQLDCLNSHTAEVFRVLQTLRNDEMFCDIKLVTDDGTIIFLGHKIVLISASPYFWAMFTRFEESNKD